MSDPSRQVTNTLGKTVKPATGSDLNKAVKDDQMGNMMAG